MHGSGGDGLSSSKGTSLLETGLSSVSTWYACFVACTRCKTSLEHILGKPQVASLPFPFFVSFSMLFSRSKDKDAFSLTMTLFLSYCFVFVLPARDAGVARPHRSSPQELAPLQPFLIERYRNFRGHLSYSSVDVDVRFILPAAAHSSWSIFVSFRRIDPFFIRNTSRIPMQERQRDGTKATKDEKKERRWTSPRKANERRGWNRRTRTRSKK